MSKVLSLHHIVFRTKGRVPALVEAERENICRMLWSLVKEEKCYLYRVNCVPDHVYMLIDLNATRALSDVVGKVKAVSSICLKKSGKFPLFDGWGEGYYASGISLSDRDSVIEYIKNQQEHHAGTNFESEMKRLYRKAGLPWHDNDII
ncbi:MAG: IS200/IS605 family transposase [Muribaculaceae bacterium]|nr:IS200/IS605 family transposase [Muribaculaceae bacterium]